MNAALQPLGIRVDVDTHEGMRDGVPRLLEIFDRAGVRATFYFAMGPDRSGRAIFQALRPGFLAKMRRTGAARIYGWRTVLSGTLLPSRPVATAFPAIARRARERGHETGVHAWDHRSWQDRLLRFSDGRVEQELSRGRAAYREIFGEQPATFAAPAWFTDERALIVQESFGLSFASDCRGTEPFLPVVCGKSLATPQVPSTLPTLDEALGWTHEDAGAFFRSMAKEGSRGGWPVLTVHAELEGGPYAPQFEEFLCGCRALGLAPVALGELLALRRAEGTSLPPGRLELRPVPGRHGRLATQTPA